MNQLTTAQPGQLTGPGDLTEAWNAAALAWLETKTGRTGSRNTRRAYEHALTGWLSFLAGKGAGPGQAAGVHVNTYRQELEAAGLAPATVAQRLAALSSFYCFCRDKFTLQGPGGREVTLITYNPIDRAERPRVEAFSNSQKVDVADLPKLLAAPDRETLQGKRDYSILLTYLMTGRRLVELARLTWGDIRISGQAVFYTYTGKGHKRNERQLPPPAWLAISEYTAACKRQIHPAAPVWAAHSEAGQYLPNVTSAETEKPLSVAMIRRLVNRYTRLALGAPVSPHALRHAAAALRKRAGDDPHQIQKFLDHSNLATTAGYLEKIDPAKDTSWQAAANLLGVEY